MAEFKKGDVVKLKSGSPTMTVEEPNYKDAFSGTTTIAVVFFNGAEVSREKFVPEALEHVKT